MRKCSLLEERTLEVRTTAITAFSAPYFIIFATIIATCTAPYTAIISTVSFLRLEARTARTGTRFTNFFLVGFITAITAAPAATAFLKAP